MWPPPPPRHQDTPELEKSSKCPHADILRVLKYPEKCMILGPSSILPQSLIPQSSILILIIINPSSILILNPQCSSSSSILNCLSSIPAPKSRQKCGILGPKCPQKCLILGKMSARIACSFFQLCPEMAIRNCYINIIVLKKGQVLKLRAQTKMPKHFGFMSCLIWNIIWKEMKLCAFCYFNTQSGSSGKSLVTEPRCSEMANLISEPILLAVR